MTESEYGTFKPYPLALKLPPMGAVEYENMRDDMKARGFNAAYPVIVSSDTGELLDGCHRVKCWLSVGGNEADIPITYTAAGEDPVDVIKRSENKRTWLPGQRQKFNAELIEDRQRLADKRRAEHGGSMQGARGGGRMLTANSAVSIAGDKPGTAAVNLAVDWGVSERTAESIIRVKKEDPEMFTELTINGGSLSPSAAEAKLRERRPPRAKKAVEPEVMDPARAERHRVRMLHEKRDRYYLLAMNCVNTIAEDGRDEEVDTILDKLVQDITKIRNGGI